MWYTVRAAHYLMCGAEGLSKEIIAAAISLAVFWTVMFHYPHF